MAKIPSGDVLRNKIFLTLYAVFGAMTLLACVLLVVEPGIMPLWVLGAAVALSLIMGALYRSSKRELLERREAEASDRNPDA